MEVTRASAKSIHRLAIILFLFIFVHTSYGINLGLIAGDLKRSGPGPLVVRKVSHHSPVIINVNPGLPKLPGISALPKSVPKLPKLSGISALPKSVPKSQKLPNLAILPPLPIPKLPAKPPPTLLKTSKVKRSPFSPLFPLLPPPLLLPPTIPHLPLFPVIPPKLPSLLPFMPPPLLGLPRLPKLSPFHPLRAPILGLSPLEKTLGTIKLPVVDQVLKRTICKDLLDLKIKGSLTTPEFLRFKKLLL